MKKAVRLLCTVLCSCLLLPFTGCSRSNGNLQSTSDAHSGQNSAAPDPSGSPEKMIYATTESGAEITGSAEFTVQRPRNTGGTVSATRYGLSETNTGAENVAAMDQLLTAVLEYNNTHDDKVTAINIPTGTYRFGGISVNRIAITGLKNVIFEGNHSTFIFEDSPVEASNGKYFMLENCNQFELRNLTLIWDWEMQPLSFLGTVCELHPETNEVDFSIAGEHNIPEDLQIGSSGGGVGRSWNSTFNQRDDDNGFKGGTIASSTKLSNRLIRVKYTAQSVVTKASIGQEFLFYIKPKMSTSAFGLHNCEHITLDNVTVHSVPYEIMISLASEYIQILNCTVQPAEGNGQRITSVGGFEIHSTGGYFRMENCMIDGIGDDNIHISNHFFGGENKKLGDRTVLLTGLSRWSSIDMVYVGATMEIRDGKDFIPIGWSSVVESFTHQADDSGYTYTVTFRDPLPEHYTSDMMFWNTDGNTGNVIIRNNTFQNGPCAALYIGLPNVTIEKNLFSNVGCSAIVATTVHRWGKWYLGAPLSNLVIKDNTFRDCDMGKHDTSVIFVGAGYDYNPSDFYPVHWALIDRVLIEGNALTTSYSSALMVFSTQEIIVRNNSFTNSNLRPINRRFRNRGNVTFDYVEKLLFENNVIQNTESSLETGVWHDEDTCKNFTIK